MHATRGPLWSRFIPATALSLLMSAGCGDREPVMGPTSADITALAAVSAAATGSISLVVSQVYGGGGNSGAPFNRDYVEIFNRGTTTASLAGLSVQYASATGTGTFGANAGQLLALSGSVQPGQYYLVELAGGSTGEPLPTPDATGTINMAAGAGKVALVTGTDGLGCNGGSTPCTPEQLARIIDLVGYGNANFFEGSAAAPTLSNTTAALRLDDGCRDTDDNRADFAAGAPAPRNTSSPLAPCPVGPAVAGTDPAADATNVPLDATIGVTFSEPVTVTGTWYTVVCTVSGARTATTSGGPTTFTIEVDGAFAAAESCTVTVSAAGVTSQGPPAVPMQADFAWSFTTFDSAVCELPFTGVYEIQGSGSATPLAGQTVTTQGVVIGDFRGLAPALGGFYIQALVGDDDPATSDGIFVFNRGRESQAPGLRLGDLVRVSGRAAEFQDQTQIDNVTATIVCGGGFTIEPTTVTLPFPTDSYLERYEGMLVRLPQTLTVTEHFQLGRFGEVVMSSGGRLRQPTQDVMPGGPALALQAANDRNRIIVDDELNNQNRDPILFGRGGNPLTAANTLRGGDTATGIVGVMTYGWAGAAASGNAFRVRPVNALGGSVPNFSAANPRPTGAPSIDGGLRAVGYNLYNYFNEFSGCTGGVGGAPIECRGAGNAMEFERQWRKTVAAIVGMDADVLGLVEMQNNGFGPNSAIADLVSRLNAVTSPGTYAFIDASGPVGSMGTDAIMNAIIYKPARVKPVGLTAVLNTDDFVFAGNDRPGNRPAVSQAFEQQSNGARFILTVNHLRSKGGSPCTVPDQGDGQGNCNVMRTNAVNRLLQWLGEDPTGTGVPDVLLVGDLNAYAKEDPIRALEAAGFTNLAGSGAYSYAFGGQWGTLDYAMASRSLVSQVRAVAAWHINSDEPMVLDFSTSFKSANQLATLYAPDEFRASDHDPVLVGLDLRTPLPFTGFLPPVANLPGVNRVNAGSVVPLKFGIGGDLGMNIFAAGYPASRTVSCSTWAATGTLQRIETPGGRGLSFDGATGAYEINWSTDRTWGGTCRELVVRFTDGSEQRARFDFR